MRASLTTIGTAPIWVIAILVSLCATILVSCRQPDVSCTPSYLVLRSQGGDPVIPNTDPPTLAITIAVFGCENDLDALTQREIEDVRLYFQDGIRHGFPLDFGPLHEVNSNRETRRRLCQEINRVLGRSVITDVMVPTWEHIDYWYDWSQIGDDS